MKKVILATFFFFFSLYFTIPAFSLPPITKEKFSVTFDDYPSLTHVCFIDEITNLQDVPDDFPYKAVLGDTSVDINKITVTLEEWKEELHNVTEYGTVCSPYEYDTINMTHIYEPNCTRVETGWHWEGGWLGRKIMASERDADELRNQWEEIHLKKGETKKFKRCYYFNDVPKHPDNGWGSYGSTYIESSGQVYSDLSHSSWWNSTWPYCYNLNIDIAYANLDYVYNISLNTTNFDWTHTQPEGQDIRIVNASCNSGGTEMSYWIENFSSMSNSLENTIWFRGDNTTNTAYSLYTGYADAPAASSGTNTFIDFVQNDTTSGWTVSGCTVLTDPTNNKYLKINCTINSANYAYRDVDSYHTEFVAEFRFKQISVGPEDFSLFLFADGSVSSRYLNAMMPAGTGYQHQWAMYYNAATNYIGDWTEGTEYVMVFYTNESDSSTGVSGYQLTPSRVHLSSGVNTPHSYGSPSDTDQLLFYDVARPASALDYRIKWLFFRPYRTPEPVVTIGAEISVPPQWFNNMTKISSPAVYSPTDVYGFEVEWSDDFDANGYNFSYFEHNFTGAFINYTTSRSGNVSYYNITSIPAGTYLFRFYANDSNDAWNVTDQWEYTINKAATSTQLLLDGFDGDKSYIQYNMANFTAVINISGVTAKLSSNYTGWVTQSGVTPLENITNLTRIGTYWNMTGYFEGNANYTGSSATHYFNVTKFVPIPEYAISIALFEERELTIWEKFFNFKYKDIVLFGVIIGDIKMGGNSITDVNNIEATGNVTAENVFLPSFIFAHQNNTMPVGTAGLWHNVTFDEEESSPKLRINHTHTDTTNTTFTIVDDGYYDMHYAMSFSDSSPAPSSHIVMRIVLNEIEIEGSLIEEDSTKQYSDFTISNGVIKYLERGDKIQFQFAADATTVSLDSHRTYGEHHDTGVVKIIRIG